MDWKLILISLIGLFGLFLLIKPLKFLLRLVAYMAVGGALLYLANLLLSRFDLQIAMNPATMLAAGVLNIPGVIMLAVLRYFFM